MELLQTKEIKLQNFNNKLICTGFVVINIPPEKDFTTADKLQIFELQVNGVKERVQVIDVIVVKFSQIGIWHTMPAFGMTEGEFDRYWLKNHPDTRNDTELGVYYFRRV